jgi:hypothetical protein
MIMSFKDNHGRKNNLAQLTPLSPSKLITRANISQRKGKLHQDEKKLMIRNETNFHQEARP